MIEDQAGTSDAARMLHVALRNLHIQAGAPSSRAIAGAIGGTSHTTVNSALRSGKIPSWPILSKIVAHLGGDEEKFRELWSATRDAGDEVDPLPLPTSSMQAEVSVFASYARDDDSSSYSRISKLVLDIALTYKSLTGRDVGVFKDTTSIELGEDWRDRIRMGLSASSVLLAFVSPAYLRSPMCREEFTEFLAFLDTNSTNRLMIPLLFAKMERIDKYFKSDDLWAKVLSLNYLDVSELRTFDPGSSGWIESVEKVADRIEDVLSSREVVAALAYGSNNAKAAPAKPISSSKLEILAAMETEAPRTVESITKVAGLIEQFGSLAQDSAPIMAQAATFGQKLAVSKLLANDLMPVADEMVEIVDSFESGIKQWDEGVGVLFEMIRLSPEQASDPGVEQFLQAVSTLSNIGIQSFAQLETFHASMGAVLGFSAELDKPLKKMRGVVLTLSQLTGLFRSWQDNLTALKSFLNDR